MKTKQIIIPVASVKLTAYLTVPDNAYALVIMGRAHERTRLSDKLMCSELHENNIATLSLDLLLPVEGEVDQKQYNIELLTERLIATTHWLQEQPLTRNLVLGYYGSGLEAATALRSAAGLLHQIKAVVICDGELRQALNVLHQINAPTLLIGGSSHRPQYQEALNRITTEKELIMVGVGEDEMEEPRRSAQIAALGVEWFADHFRVVA